MSGWDVSSTPTWGSQDGPDETQAFAASGNNGARDHGQDFNGGYSGDNRAGGPPPEFFGQEYGQEQELGPSGYPQRTPGQSFQDLPRRESARDSRRAGGGYGQDDGYGQGGGTYGQQEYRGGAEDQGGRWGQGGQGGQDNGFGQDTAFGQDWGGAGGDDRWAAPEHGGQDDGGWGRTAGRSAAPWDERPQQDAGFGGQDDGFGRQQENFGYAAQDYPPQAGQDYPGQAGQEYPGQAGQDYPGQAGQEYPGQYGRGAQAPMEFGRQDRDSAARNDPALQDFFAPSPNGSGWSGGEQPRDRFRPADEEADWTGRPKGRPAADPDVDWTGRPKARPAGDPDVDWTGRPKARPAADGDVDWTGRPRGQRPAAGGRGRGSGDDDDARGGIGMKGIFAIGAVIVIVIAAAAYMFLRKGTPSTPAASNTPATAQSSAASKAATSKAATAGGSGAATAAAYAFVSPLPATAGGYPLGTDPNDLASAKATAAQIVTAVGSGGGGTAKGNPVSAAYTLPASQAIGFVGYTGTFTPAKIATILASLGSNANTYPAGPDGGILGCANTKATPSGAVCVWATASTLGVIEFYAATGPETLNTAQAKGAADALKVRNDLEKKA